MTIKSFSLRSPIGQSIFAFADAINNILSAINPISLIDANLLTEKDRVGVSVIDFSMQYKSSGLANYRADSVTYDNSLGTTFDAQIQDVADAADLFPRVFLDATSRTDHRLEEAVIIISEETESNGFDGSYAISDQNIITRNSHIVTADENIASGASGNVTLFSPSGRSTQITGINRGPVALSTSDRAYAIFDPITQSLYLYPTCC